jgi:hypothetical protein
MPSMKSLRLAHLPDDTWNRSFNIVVARESARHEHRGGFSHSGAQHWAHI